MLALYSSDCCDAFVWRTYERDICRECKKECTSIMNPIFVKIKQLKKKEEYINLERADDPSYYMNREYNEAIDDVISLLLTSK